MRVLIVIITIILALPAVAADLFTVNLHQSKLSDLARVVYGDILKFSYVMQSEFLTDASEVSVNWQGLQGLQVEQLTRDLIHAKGFEVIKSGGVLTIRKTLPADDELLIYAPLHRSAKYLADMLLKVAQKTQLGTRSLSSPSPMPAAVAQPNQSPASPSPMPEAMGAASATFDRSALDQLAYTCAPAECVRLRKLLVQLDTPEANVMLRAVIYEVQTAHGEGSALQLLGNITKGGNLINLAAGNSLAGSVMTFQLGGFSAILSALDNDSRFKSLARPSMRVKTGATAKFSVGAQVPILGALSQDRNGNNVQSVEYRPSGTIFTVTPDIRGAVIDLNIVQELSTFTVTTVGVNNSPTLLQRLASSSLTLRENEVVVFAGLEEERDNQTNSKLFGLFPTSRTSDKLKSEILLFIEAQKI